MTIYNLVTGWTDFIDFQILLDGVAPNLTGYGVPVMYFRDKNGTTLTVNGTVSWQDASTAKARFLPSDANQIKDSNAPLRVRAELTDGAGRKSYIPNAQPDEWHVGKK
jgi:hypothetical protein